MEAQILVHGIPAANADDKGVLGESVTPDFGNPKSSTHDLYKRYHQHLVSLETQVKAFSGIVPSFSDLEEEWGEYFGGTDSLEKIYSHSSTLHIIEKQNGIRK